MTLAAAACATFAAQPQTAPAPGGPLDALGCERSEVEQRGYQVVDADTVVWLIRADRSRGDAIGNVDAYDELTLRVHSLPDGRYALRVVVDAFQVTQGDTAGKVGIDPSPQARRDVREILEACGAPADGT
jgi:hypothetical protein